MNNLHSAVDLLPSYVGSVVPDAAAVGWKGACFFENEARLEFVEHDEDGDRESANGCAILHIKTAAAHSWTCMDLYVFATPYRMTWDYYFSAREYTLVIKSWEEPAEMEYGEEIIVVIPWDERWDLALKDDSNPQIALLPLHPDLRAKFNETAAWPYACSMSGKPYGYHNMIFS